METDTDFVLVMYMYVTPSPLNKMMVHSNSALWTIPKFDFRNVYQYFWEIKKKTVHFQIQCSPDPDQRGPV